MQQATTWGGGEESELEEKGKAKEALKEKKGKNSSCEVERPSDEKKETGKANEEKKRKRSSEGSKSKKSKGRRKKSVIHDDDSDEGGYDDEEEAKPEEVKDQKALCEGEEQKAGVEGKEDKDKAQEPGKTGDEGKEEAAKKAEAEKPSTSKGKGKGKRGPLRDQSKSKKFNEVWSQLPESLRGHFNSLSRSDQTSFIHSGVERSKGHLTVNRSAMFGLVTKREESQSGMQQMKGYGLEELCLSLIKDTPP